MKKNFCIVFIITLIITIACYMMYINFDRLTDVQIEALRDEYPICFGEPYGVSMIYPSLEDITSIADTFVYAKIVGDVKRYTIDISVENDALEEKHKQYGISNTYEFYEYTLEIIRDTEKQFTRSNGQTITIVANSMFEEYYPVLKKDMRVVVPVHKRNDNKYDYTKYGFYYVTEDDYVLSAFEESSISSKSGIKINSLMDQLKKQS